MQKFFLAFLCACMSALALFASSSADALTVEEIWKSPQLANPILSRSGKFLAATAPLKGNGRMNLMVLDMDTRKGTLITNFEDFDVINVHWVGDERLVFSLGQANSPTGPGQFDGGGLFVVGRDGANARRLAATVREARARNQYVYRELDFFRTLPGSTDEIIAAGNQTSADSVDLYRLNLNTGRTTLLTSGRPASLTQNWLLDSKLVPRVVVAGVKDELTQIVYYRKSADAPWEEISRYSPASGSVFVPMAFENDDQMMQVATNQGRDTMAVFRYDPNTKKLGELVAAHPRYDMGANSQGEGVPGALVDGETNKILGYRVQGDKLETFWTDESRAKTQRTIDAALPDTINTFRRTPDGKRLLVSAFSDVKQIRWYLLDEDKRTLEEIGAARPWLDGKLVQQIPFRYTTRDGLEIPGYVFLPKGYKPGTKLPTVVHIHGGPFGRSDTFGDGFGYIEGQLFASKGYAVVVPNFRVTPGLGNKIYTAGFGTYGRQMSEDHEDALKWAIEQGYTDPKRVCMSGASYGGYAALWALVKTPELFKCAVAGLAPTDLEYQRTTRDGDGFYNEAGNKYWLAVVGVKSWSDPVVRQVSPLFFADKIKGAVFLYAGRDDIRVPIDQINRMDKALRAAGNPAKAYVVKDKEGHGYGKYENRIDLYTQVLQFLDEQIGK